MTAEYSAEVRYHPWVGDRYWDQPQRWLILGESGYGLGAKEATAVQEMIRAHCGAITDSFDTGTYRVCAGAQRLMTGRDSLRTASTRDFWQTVVFYNYVRESMKDAAQRPTTKQFRDSHRAFNEVVCKARPHGVLVLGLKLWMALPGERDGWTKGPEQDIVMPVPRSSSRRLSVWTGNAEDTTCTHRFACFPVVHPSSIGFAANKWRDWMLAAKRAVAASHF
jgi:hypothetical protein